MKFRKKPVVIEAYQNDDVCKRPKWIDDAFRFGLIKVAGSGALNIYTLEGTMRAEPGDWIIKGIADELYPCKPDIFEATYEPVDDATGGAE